MRGILLSLFVIVSLVASAQDTTFFDKEYTKIKTITLRKNKVRSTTTEFTYYESGKIKTEKHFADYSMRIPDGPQIYWYENDTISRKENYVNGQLDGQLNCYWPDGKLKREDTYSMGEFLSGHKYNMNGSIDTLRDSSTTIPTPSTTTTTTKPKTEIRDIASYISHSIRQPQEKLAGKIYVSFAVDEDGSVSDVRILRGISPEIDQQVREAIEAAPRWVLDVEKRNPGQQKYVIAIAIKKPK